MQDGAHVAVRFVVDLVQKEIEIVESAPKQRANATGWTHMAHLGAMQ